MKFEEIKLLIENKLPRMICGEDLDASPKALIIKADSIHQVCTFLHSNKKTYFDSLSCLTGLDNTENKNSFEVIYNLYSIPNATHLMLKVELDKAKPIVDSLSDIWHTANWHEREAYDLFGIHFKGHPDLRRILLPNDWQGHPLRKDYVHQEKYHELKVKY